MIRVQQADFDPGAELGAVGSGNRRIGAVCSFIGLVRDLAGDRPVEALILEHYPGFTEKCLAAIEDTARARWKLEDALLVHRYGRLEPGERIVLVAAAAAHRRAAFEACEFMIDRLKTRAAFWKREDGAGERRWLEPAGDDAHAAARWDPTPR